MNLSTLRNIFRNNGATKIYVKKLAPNDNSKNQVYLGGNFDVLNMFPVFDITHEPSGDWERERFKGKVNFHWVNEDGVKAYAPNAQLILYPKYPEVRFSGFLLGCKDAPSELMRSRLPGRVLFMSIDNDGNILGYVAHPDSAIIREVDALDGVVQDELLFELPQEGVTDTKVALLTELRRIHRLGWIKSKRLNREGKIVDCNAPQCGGYTLEAELGVTPNRYADPDYLGWEIKQFGVRNFNRLNSAVITLMTPEPTGGFYTTSGVEYFVRKYGYQDKLGRPDRLNFGGIYKVGIEQPTTKLTMQLIGFDSGSGKIRNTDGSIALVDQSGNVAAEWSFTSMLKHWNRKHRKACYIPSLKQDDPYRQYTYGGEVILGEGTNFMLFLAAMASGELYYDPAIKVENASTDSPTNKRRSQFRIKSGHLSELYHRSNIVDVNS